MAISSSPNKELGINNQILILFFPSDSMYGVIFQDGRHAMAETREELNEIIEEYIEYTNTRLMYHITKIDESNEFSNSGNTYY